MRRRTKAWVWLGAIMILLTTLAGCIDGSQETTGNLTTTSDEVPGQPADNDSPAEAAPGNAEPKEATGALSNLLTFQAPVEMTPAEEDHGFEPSIVAGPEGALYLTANAGFRVDQSQRAASWLWVSQDGGASWGPVTSPEGLHEKLYGIEGDIAVDGQGRLYFVDMAGSDNTFSRWHPTPDGPVWDFTRPIQGTAAPVDDRPWLAAHGDGIVYYMAFTGLRTDADRPETPGPTPGEPMWLHRSTDGGMTWDVGQSFPGALHCEPAANPADDQTLLVGCRGSDPSEPATAWWSADRGQRWETVELGPTGPTPEPGFLSADIGPDGTGLVAWPVDDVDDGSPGSVRVAWGSGQAGWNTAEADLGNRTIGSVWAAAGNQGMAALAVYASPDVPVKASSPWHLHVLVATELTSEQIDWTHAQITEEPVGWGTEAPPDFLQVTTDPDARIHVAFQRTPASSGMPPGCCLTGYGSDVFVVSQATGPNLGR